MAPYFESVKSFADVPFTHDGVETWSFLEASDGLIQMFELFGNAVFGFVQADLKSNINGVRARYESSTDTANTLENLAKSEFSESHRHATGCLIRLIRGLALTCCALKHMQQDTSAQLHVCFRSAYDQVLRHHHSWLLQSVIYLAIRAVPQRHDFYKQLIQDGSSEKFDMELGKWLASLDQIVKHMSTFLEQGGFGRV